MTWYNKDMNIKFGTDTEFILKDENGIPRSAIPYISGTKDKPLDCPGGNLQFDNVALEIAVNASTSIDDIPLYLRSCLESAHEYIPKGWTINPLPSVVMPEEEVQHPESIRFGCDPDYDAKTNDVNEIDRTFVDPKFRSFGLHIHIGSPLLTYHKGVTNRRIAVLSMDFTLGLLSTVLDNSEEALARRQLYGLPSAYRTKPYGVEYRTLSNYWSKSPTHLKLAFHMADLAMAFTNTDKFKTKILSQYDLYYISHIIMKGMKDEAWGIWKEVVRPYAHPAHCQMIKDLMSTQANDTVSFYSAYDLLHLISEERKVANE